MEKIKLIRKVFLMTQGHIEMIERIQHKLSLPNFITALRYCVTLAHSKEFPEYVQVQKDRLKVDPVDRAKIKEHAKAAAAEEREELKKKKDYEHRVAICSLLEGEVTTHPDTGRPACKYTQYGMLGPSKIDETEFFEDLENLNDETPTYQYQDVFGNTGEFAKANFERVKNGERPIPKPKDTVTQ